MDHASNKQRPALKAKEEAKVGNAEPSPGATTNQRFDIERIVIGVASKLIERAENPPCVPLGDLIEVLYGSP